MAESKLIKYLCSTCRREFYIRNDQKSGMDIDFGCPYGCDDACELVNERQQYECMFYNGELSHYDLLDFDPNGLSNSEIVAKAVDALKQKYSFSEKEAKGELEHIYLLPVDSLIRL